MKIKLLLGSFLVSTLGYGLQTYKIKDQQQTHGVASKKHHTRVAVQGDRIQQVFGAEGVFELETDETCGQIFLKLLIEDSSDPVTLTLVTEEGVTQDLKLTPKDVEAQSILLALEEIKETHAPAPKPSRQETLSKLMVSMVQDRPLTGYDKTPLHTSDRQLSSIFKLTPRSIYRGEELEGRVYDLALVDPEKELPIEEKAFSRVGDVAISVSSKIIFKHPLKLYVISSREAFL